MRYTKSKDGVERASIQVIIRATREEILYVRKLLKEHNQDCSDKSVRQFIGNEAREGWFSYGVELQEDPHGSRR